MILITCSEPWLKGLIKCQINKRYILILTLEIVFKVMAGRWGKFCILSGKLHSIYIAIIE